MLSSARFATAVLLILGGAVSARAAEPAQMAEQIEQQVQTALAAAKIPASPLADDAEFLRRVCLDITGRIPTYDQAVAFLDDPAADKRARLIDELLARPEYGLHFATLWRDLMVDRSSDMSQVRNNFSWEFVAWLAQGLNEDRGWDELVTQMLVAEGEAKSTPATTFLLAGRMNSFPRPEIITAATGKLFLGIQIGCAQCHDHPYVEEWKQDDFWGLAAFFNQLRDHNLEANGNSQNPKLLEAPLESEDKLKRYLGNLKRLALLPPESGGKISVPDGARPGEALRTVKARFLLGEEPALEEEGPHRTYFAQWLTSPANPYFAKAQANRLWAHFFGSGIINPVDDLSPQNKPSHPELLELLSRELAANRFSLKHLIRCVCNSPAYQRTSKPLAGNAADRQWFSHHPLKLLSPDQMVDSVAIASGRTPQTGKNREQSTALFVTKEADAPATEFSHGIPQFLYQMNGYAANNTPGQLGKLTNGKSPEEAIANVYLMVLSRRPREAELEKMKAFVAGSPNPSQGYRDAYWVLLNSAEFLFVR